MQERGFNSFASNMIKLSVNETKQSNFLPGHALFFFIFRFEYLISCPKLPGLSRNGPLAPMCEYQTIKICLRRLPSQERLCSMSMKMMSFQKHKNLVECDSVFSSALLTRIPKLNLLLHNKKGIWLRGSPSREFI